MILYNLNEIADILGVSYKTAQNKITKAGFSKVKTINKRAMYSEAQLNVLKQRKNEVVYEIYESKINYLTNL